MRPLLTVAATLAMLVGTLGAPAQAATFVVQGTIRDIGNSAPLQGVCVSLGPPTNCTTSTDANGFYRIELPDNPNIEWEMFWNKEGYQMGASGRFTVAGTKTINTWLFPGAGSCPRGPTPLQTVYLPNITKTLGGPDGFQTPFIVQNVNRFTITALTLDFYRFSDGALILQRQVCALRPGTSYALVPNLMSDLPHDTQFSVVVNAFHAPIVSVVNEHSGSGARAEAASYTGASAGATSVFLPNITKRFFGYVTPFIIQNLGTATTTATASFVSFDGTKTATLQRTIAPGRSQFINPNVEPLLADGTQYAVTVTSTQPVSVVVNTHNDAPEVAQPVFYSTNGIAAGAATLQGPYAVKNVAGVGKGVSTIVVQNLGAAAATPTLEFTPLGGGPKTLFSGPSVASKASWAFDPRYTNGSTLQAFCGAAASTGCLGDGEYSFVANGGTGAQIAAVVNVIGAATASGYSAIAAPSTVVYFPNVTRTLGGADGWTTPIVLQSVSAATVTLSWYRFSDGTLVTTQSLPVPAGTAVLVDPRLVAGLPDDTQFAVVADGNGGVVTGIVSELNFQGGDGAMVYEGFAR